MRGKCLFDDGGADDAVFQRQRVAVPDRHLAPGVVAIDAVRALAGGALRGMRIADLGLGGDRHHPWHPAAVESFTSPIWQAFFFDYDVQERLSPMQWLHPFLDLRVVQFLLRVPPVPWAWKKALLRRAMRGRLPEPILTRPKTPLGVYPRGVGLKQHGLSVPMAADRLAGYVDTARLPGLQDSDVALAQSIYAYVLDHWLATMPAPGPGQRTASL